MWTFVTASVHGGAKLQHCTHQTCEVFQCVSHQSSLCDVLICMLSSWMLLLTSSLQTSIARFAKAVHACAKRQCTSACLVIACNEAWRVWQYLAFWEKVYDKKLYSGNTCWAVIVWWAYARLQITLMKHRMQTALGMLPNSAVQRHTKQHRKQWLVSCYALLGQLTFSVFSGWPLCPPAGSLRFLLPCGHTAH